ITGDRVEMLNIDWSFAQSELKATLGLSRLLVVNDFAALAWALPELARTDVVQVGGGQPQPRQPLAVLGPGSGLGIATYLPTEGGAVVAGEGGHATMPAANDAQADVIALLRHKLGHCSAERVLSGPGLMNLYWAITQLERQPRTATSPAEIT